MNDSIPKKSLILSPIHTSGEHCACRRRSTYKIFIAGIGCIILAGALFAVPKNTDAFWFFHSTQTFAQGATASVATSGKSAVLRAPINSNPSEGANEVAIAITGSATLLGNVGPDSMSSFSFHKKEQRATNGQISLYVVRPGDSLSDIAQMFGVSVNTILWANNITNRNIIKPGMTLTILPISGIRHTVKKGETLASLAKKYHGNVDDIALYNGISSKAILSSGTVIVIPGGEIRMPRHVARGARHGMGHYGHPRITHAPYNPYRGGSGPSLPGFFSNPLPGGIITQGLHGWNAVDIAAPTWTKIHAAAPGTVIVAHSGGWGGGYGNYVVINHGNGTQTLYAHMVRDISHVGEKVSRGEIIGYVGMTGEATGPHLHFEVRGARNPFVGCRVGRVCYPKTLMH